MWRCRSDICLEQWASEGGDSTCPFCHLAEIERTEFTCGQVADAQEKFGFRGALPVHLPQPVPDVVQLSTLPRDLWVGLPVFHPIGQEGNLPDWRCFDVGVVMRVHPHPDLSGEFKCEFVAGFLGGVSTLRYSPWNLWVPTVLAARIAG